MGLTTRFFLDRNIHLTVVLFVCGIHALELEAPPKLFDKADTYEQTMYRMRRIYRTWRDSVESVTGKPLHKVYRDPVPHLFQRVLDEFPGRPPRALVGDRGGWRRMRNVYVWFKEADPLDIEKNIVRKAHERLANQSPIFARNSPSLDSLLHTMEAVSSNRTRYANMHLYANLTRCEVGLSELNRIREETRFATRLLENLRRRLSPASPLHEEIKARRLGQRLGGAPSYLDSMATGLVRKAYTDQIPVLERIGGDAELAVQEVVRLAIRAHGVDRLVFATRTTRVGYLHFYENFGYSGNDPNDKLYGHGGRLVQLDLRTSKTTDLLRDIDGAVRDPQVHYDAKKILFSYRPGGTDQYHLYEIDTSGNNLRRLTHGIFDDVEPTYTPADSIIFCSSRRKRYVPCFYAPVAILHKCGPDGGNVHPLSANVETECTPWMLPDGRVLFMRWEYTDRDHFNFHQLWTCNPDGTNQMTYFGNMVFDDGATLVDAKPIPGTGNVIAVNSHGHGRNEHAGPVVTLDPTNGPDDLTRQKYLTPKKKGEMVYRDPWAFSDDLFMAAREDRLVVMDSTGAMATLYTLRETLGVDITRNKYWVHEPRPIRKRPREHIVPAHTNKNSRMGTMFVADVTVGRNMTGVDSGDIDKLLIVEVLPKPTHTDGHTEPISYDGTFMLERILGTVPVQADGSAHFEVPALRPVFFVALDSADNSVKRMHSFVSVMPGERVGCVGCHENRTRVSARKEIIPAVTRPPSRITPLSGIPDIYDYQRDIQPILDRHCVRCHSNIKRAGNVVLTDDLGPWFCASYVTLVTRKLVNPSSAFTGVNRFGNSAPRTVGAVASKLMDKLDGGHHGVKVSPHEEDLIRYWIESGSVYAGTYAGLNTLGSNRYPVDNDVAVRRCIACHDRRTLINRWGGPRKANWKERSGLWVNFTHPESSLVLLAPLAQEAGGYGMCRDSTGKKVAVYKSRPDADYRAMLESIREAAREGLRNRFERADFRPTKHYVREMKRYGVLPRDWTAKTSGLNVYQIDEKYFRSFWKE